MRCIFTACMNQKHLLRFIKHKLRYYPQEVVIFRDEKHLTLGNKLAWLVAQSLEDFLTQQTIRSAKLLIPPSSLLHSLIYVVLICSHPLMMRCHPSPFYPLQPHTLRSRHIPFHRRSISVIKAHRVRPIH